MRTSTFGVLLIVRPQGTWEKQSPWVRSHPVTWIIRCRCARY